MVAGLGAYGRVLADPSARAFSLAGLRRPAAAVDDRSRHRAADLHHHRLVRSRRAGHRGRHRHRRRRGAGLGPADRPGRTGPGAGHRHVDQQRQPGRADHQRAAGLAAARAPWPRPSGSGWASPSAGACVRARWTHRLRGDGHCSTPPSPGRPWSTRWSSSSARCWPPSWPPPSTPRWVWRPASCWGWSVRSRWPPSAAPNRRCSRGDRRQAAASAAVAGVLVPIMLACAALGALFGGMEVVIVAFAEEAGICRSPGFLIDGLGQSARWSPGVITGTITWRASPLPPVPDRSRRAGRLAGAAAVRRPAR